MDFETIEKAWKSIKSGEERLPGYFVTGIRIPEVYDHVNDAVTKA